MQRTTTSKTWHSENCLNFILSYSQAVARDIEEGADMVMVKPGGIFVVLLGLKV